MNYYYGIFRKTPEAIEVEFPDLPGCVTFGTSWEEAIENATDVLAGWLAHAGGQFVSEPSLYEQIRSKYANATVMPIFIDEQIKNSYLHGKNMKVSFPAKLYQKLDYLSKAQGVKTGNLVREAVAEYVTKKS